MGIAESGNHDQRQYEDDWGERYQGPLVKNPDGTDNYSVEATQTHAAGLKGRLFLIHDGMDNNVPPYMSARRARSARSLTPTSPARAVQGASTRGVKFGFDVTADGQRFVMITRGDLGSSPLTMVVRAVVR